MQMQVQMQMQVHTKRDKLRGGIAKRKKSQETG